VSDKGEGNSRRSDSTSESFGTIGVSGAYLILYALSETRFEGENSVVHCSTAVRPVVGVKTVDGSWVRETASEREACEEKSQGIL